MKKIILALLFLPSVAFADWAIPPTFGNPGCTTIDDFMDGHKGAAWVGRSFGSQYPTIHFPSELCGEIDHVQVWNSSNTKLADAIFLPYNFGACSKDGRVRYQVPLVAESLSPYAPLVIRAFLLNGNIDCREVLDPTQDYD